MVKNILTFIVLSFIGLTGCNSKDNCNKEIKHTLSHVTFYLPNCYKIRTVKDNPNEFFIVKNDIIKLEISLDGAVSSSFLENNLDSSLVFLDTINNCRRTIGHFKDENNSTQFYSMIIKLDKLKTDLSLFKEFSHIVKFSAMSNSNINPDLTDEDVNIFVNSFKNLRFNDTTRVSLKQSN